MLNNSLMNFYELYWRSTLKLNSLGPSHNLDRTVFWPFAYFVLNEECEVTNIYFGHVLHNQNFRILWMLKDRHSYLKLARKWVSMWVSVCVGEREGTLKIQESKCVWCVWFSRTVEERPSLSRCCSCVFVFHWERERKRVRESVC